jgi:perosamine synthetase
MEQVVRKSIPVARPTIGPVEKELVTDCLETGWISSVGKYVEQFEAVVADRLGARHALSVSNGTCALHLALMGLDIGPGDEVIVPAVTYIATANAVRYCGATVVLADVDPQTLNLTAETVAAAITPKTRAIVPVHLYGVPCDIARIKDLADARGILLAEDCAEAIGSRFGNRCVGTIGSVGMFSFFGNKTVTTGEGGMLVTDDAELYGRCKLLRGQGMSLERRYWHPIVGYNYRMTNICAAIGIGQMKGLEQKIARRREVLASYRRHFDRRGITRHLTLPQEMPEAFSSVWMINVLLRDDVGAERDAVMQGMAERGIETRPTFYPLYQMPPYADLAGEFPGAERAMRGITLPTFEGLEEDEIAYVSDALADMICG